MIKSLTIKQNTLSPTLTRTQHITVREATTRSQTHKVGQIITPSQQITHMYIHCRKARPVKSRRHLRLAIHPLLTQDRHLRTHTGGNKGRGHILIDGKRRTHLQPRIIHIQQSIIGLLRRIGIIAQTL